MSNKRRNQLQELTKKQIKLQAILADQEERKKKYELSEQYSRMTNKLLEEAKDELTRLERLARHLEDESVKHKEKRIGYIEAELSFAIASLFPEQGFVATFDIDVDKKYPRLDVLLKDLKGNHRAPEISEGGCIGNLISISIPVSTLLVDGSKFFFLDEALANASIENKGKFQAIMEKYLDSGQQLIIISQTDDMYDNLQRREHWLNFNKKTKITESIEIKDFIVEEENINAT